MDVFLHTVIIIDIGANLGANAKAAVWWKKREREREDYWQWRSLEEIDTSDGQGLKQAQKSVISCFQRYSCDGTTASTVNDRGLVLTPVMFHVSLLFLGFQDVWIQNNPNLGCCLPCGGGMVGGWSLSQLHIGEGGVRPWISHQLIVAEHLGFRCLAYGYLGSALTVHISYYQHTFQLLGLKLSTLCFWAQSPTARATIAWSSWGIKKLDVISGKVKLEGMFTSDTVASFGVPTNNGGPTVIHTWGQRQKSIGNVCQWKAAEGSSLQTALAVNG